MSAEALARIEAAAVEFLRSFPVGWQSIPTSAEGFLCGWHAVILSMRAQYPALPCPAREELIAIFEQQSAEFALLFDMVNTDNFSVDQVAAVLYSWGREKGLNLRLGYLEQGHPPLLISHPNEDDDVLVVWVHNDGLWDGGIGHFSGMTRWSGWMYGEQRIREDGRYERGGADAQSEGVWEIDEPIRIEDG